MNESLTYNSLAKFSTVHEGNYHAIFTYNCNNQRAKMVVQQNGTPFFTRWYMGNSYMKQDSSGFQKEYTFIGGNAYTAPVVAITQGTTTKYYYLLRDYQGNIMSIFNQSYAKVKEHSYDAWGRMRNPADWSVYAPESEPWLFIGRGYTGHEHLPWFKLINMNGRLYDPLTAQFLSADNYIQSPDYTLNFNRYTYCFNNPLKYNDPTGLSALMDPKLPGGDGGGGSDNGAKNFRFYEPVFDNGLGSGQAWICRTITPRITASKENRYYYVGDGKYQNCLGEIVLFEEVYANVLAPMFDHVLVRQEAYISTHPGEKGELKAYRWITKYEPIDYSEAPALDGDAHKLLFGTSLDFTIAIPWIGFTYEAGDLANSTNGASFVSKGKAYGIEASMSYNFFIAVPTTGKLSLSEFAGKSQNFTGNWGFVSFSLSGNDIGNNIRYENDMSFGDSYNVFKIGIGFGIGGSVSKTTTTLSKSLSFYERTKWTLKM
ncbi:MAG: hypothetical protein JW830_15615 [Bacteroidales bacterium]|nr:hypothetical protein [Bacteroidales bacterium]